MSDPLQMLSRNPARDYEWDLICLHICYLQITEGSLWHMTLFCRNSTAIHQYAVFIHMPTRRDLQNISVILPGIYHIYLPDFPINSSFLFSSTVKQPIFASNSTVLMAHPLFTGFSLKRWNSLCYKTFMVGSVYFLKSSNSDLVFSQISFWRVRPDPEVAEINMALAFSALR